MINESRAQCQHVMRMRQVSEFEGLRGRRLVLTTDRTKGLRSAIGAPPHPSINMARVDWAALHPELPTRRFYIKCSDQRCAAAAGQPRANGGTHSSSTA